MRPASSALPAGNLWWTSNLGPNLTESTADVATTKSLLPVVMGVVKSSELVSKYTIIHKYNLLLNIIEYNNKILNMWLIITLTF